MTRLDSGRAKLNQQESPIWTLLAEDSGLDPEQAASVEVVRPHGREALWRSALNQAASESRTGHLVVACDRVWARTVLRVLVGRRPSRDASPSLRRVGQVLTSDGLEVLRRYALWPSATNVRVALEQSQSADLVWAQRSAVLGGGGRRTWSRALARSFLFSPLVPLLSPATALVVRYKELA